MALRRLLALVLLLTWIPAAAQQAPRLTLVAQHPTPVITTRTPGAEGNKYGFEGGRAVKPDRHPAS